MFTKILTCTEKNKQHEKYKRLLRDFNIYPDIFRYNFLYGFFHPIKVYIFGIVNKFSMFLYKI